MRRGAPRQRRGPRHHAGGDREGERALRHRAGDLHRRPRDDHEAHAETLKELGAGFVSALKSAQIRTLVGSGDLQLTLFDQANLAEVSSPAFPGERLLVCRNPALATERSDKREELLRATEAELEKVRRMVEGPRGRLRGAPAGVIGERAGRVSNRYKVAKHFALEITDGAFSYERKAEQIAEEAALDGI